MSRRVTLALAIVAVCSVAAVIPAQPALADTSTVVTLDVPTSTTADQIAVDGNAVTVLDGAYQANAIERSVADFHAGALSAPEALASGFTYQPCGTGRLFEPDCSGVVAGGGVTAWTIADSSSATLGRREADGTVTTTNVLPTYLGITTIDGDYGLIADNVLFNQDSGTIRNLAGPAGGEGVSLDAGRIYLAGVWQSNIPRNDYLVRDTTSGASLVETAPTDCNGVTDIHAAGGWLMLSCQGSAGSPGRYLINLASGKTMGLNLDNANYWLGNGFLARRLATGALQWSDLSTGAVTWNDLGTAGSGFGQVAVSRGDVPTVAWIDGSAAAHVAKLPVATSVAPAYPYDTFEPPAAPVLSADTDWQSITLNWSAADAADHIIDYVITNGTQTYSEPAGTTSKLFVFGNGIPETFRVTAYNAVGHATSQPITVAAQGKDPVGLSNANASFETSTGVLTVNWAYSQVSGNDPASSFSLEADGVSVTGIAASATSATVQLPVNDPLTTVTLTAVGARGEYPLAVEVNRIVPDTTAPAVAVQGVTAISTSTTIRPVAAAADLGGVASVDLRLSRGAQGKPLSSWTSPTGWTGKPAGFGPTMAASPGWTYCFSMRARDVAGNQSAWSAPACTVLPTDDRALARQGTWTKLTSSAFYDAAASRSSSTYSHLVTNVRASTMWVIVETCSTCGSFGFTAAGRTYWISTHSATTHYRVAIPIPWPGKLSGTVKISPRGLGHRVTIDGIATLDY
jgi:hypothetical protein